MEAQLHRAFLACAVLVAYPPGPDATRGAVLGDLLEEVDVRVEEEAQPRRERVDVEPGCERRLHVREPVGQRERELLRRRRTGLADVVPGDRDRVPAGQLGGGEAHDVGDEAHRRPRREHELLLGLVLLEDVVLNRAAEARPIDALLVAEGDVHREQRRRGGVDRHRRADRAEVDALEQQLEIDERVDGDAGAPDLADCELVVGVASEQGRHVERGGQPAPAGREQRPEPLVGVLGGPEAGELPHGPELLAVHRGVRAPRVGVLAGTLGVGRAVHRVELDARHRGARSWVHGGLRGQSRAPCAARRSGIASAMSFHADNRGVLMTTERLISADDHVDVSHDLVKQHLATKFHDDYDAGLLRFRSSMASTASVAANEQWRTQQGLAPDPNAGMGKNRRHEANGRPGHSDATARLADMDDDGVDASVNYCEVSSFRYLYLIEDGWREATRAFNETLGDFAAADPQRLIVSYQIPIHDIDAAVAEVQWAASVGCKSLQLPVYPGRARRARLLGRALRPRCSRPSRRPAFRSVATSG